MYSKKKVILVKHRYALNVPRLSTESSKYLRKLINLCSENVTAVCAMNFLIDCNDFILGNSVITKA